MTDRNDLDVATLLEALEALNDGIGIYGPDERHLFINKAADERFGQFYRDLNTGIGHRNATAEAIRRLRPDLTQEQIDPYADSLHAKYESGETYSSQTENGRQVLITYRKMSRGYRTAISVDVTELRKREKELEKARKEAEAASHSKSAFLANMSHEIRTPLNGIMGMAQVLEGTELDQAQKEFVSTILDSGKTLMALLNDVLDLSKIEAGKFDIVPTDASIHHMLRRQLKLWKPRAE
ncbi:MAG TPA: histidine kinase dimerization/phospho-acceptor domain-containing protein, partial [Hyphomonadaceae bacterium]|nr:histidine kinase dimerization/phospho-acceptor domain-containing protein [Hyphomonadaceae bacterium]